MTPYEIHTISHSRKDVVVESEKQKKQSDSE